MSLSHPAVEGQPSVPIVYINGNIVTADPRAMGAQGFVVLGGRFGEILRDGRETKSAVEGLSPSHVIDLGGRTVLPGLVESHGHLFLTGLQQQNLNLRGIKTFAELVEVVKEKSLSLPEGTWLVGEGWDHHEWRLGGSTSGRLPGADEFSFLSRAVPKHPVFLTRIDWHAAIVNQVAYETSAVHIRLDESRRPTGLLIDAEMLPVQSQIPRPSYAVLEKALQNSLALCRRHGITSFHECGASAQEIEIFEKVHTSGQLTCRMHVMADGTTTHFRNEVLQSLPRGLSSDGLLQQRAVKMFADGAMGSRGALLCEPYTDDAKTCGTAIASEDEIAVAGRLALSKGYQMATHAIGDRAAEIVLNAYETALKGKENTDHRWRLEHAQMLAPGDIQRMRRLGIVASVQCVHCTSDSKWIHARIGAKRLAERGYLWQSFKRAGIPVINGSDTPVEPMGPFVGMHAAVTRGGVRSEECLSREQALLAMTRDAAWAAFMEKETGSIEKGKRADFVVLDRDPLKCPEEQIAACKVLETFLGGAKVFSSAEGAG